MDVISLSKATKAKKSIKKLQDRLGMNGTEQGKDVRDIYANVKTRLEELEKKDLHITLYNRVSEVEANTAINLNKHNLHINSILNKNKYGLTDLAFDDFGDDSGIDHSKSTGHEFDAAGRKVKIASGQTQAEVVTTAEETNVVPRMITVSQAFNEKLTGENSVDLTSGTHTNTEVVNGKIQLKITDIYDPSINQLSNYNKVIYVDGVSGDDTAGNGSANAPYKTIKKAFDNAIHNTCIWIVREGIYTINNGLQEILSTDKAITYDTPLKGKVVFDLKRSEYNINIRMNQLNRFIGIVFQYSGGKSGSNGQRVYEYFFDGALINLQFDNCVFSDQGTPPTAAVFFTGNSSGCSVTKLQFNNCSFLTSFAYNHTGTGNRKGAYVNCAFYDDDYTSDPYNLLNARFDANYQITTNGWQNTGMNGENIGVYGGQYNWNLRPVYASQGVYESPVLDLGDNFKNIVKINQIINIPSVTTGQTAASVKLYTSTSSDNVTFSDWQPVNPDGTITSPSARYIKIKVELTGGAKILEKLIYDFTNTESTNFQNNDKVIFDGSLKLKTLHTNTMVHDTAWSETGNLFKQTIDKSSFKTIEKIQVI